MGLPQENLNRILLMNTRNGLKSAVSDLKEAIELIEDKDFIGVSIAIETAIERLERAKDKSNKLSDEQ